MSVIEKSKILSEQERIESEIAEWKRLIQKLKQKNEQELSKEPKILSKPICLSNLKSPDGSTNIKLSKSELSEKVRYCVNCILKLGEEVLP
jgi:hypothetical protein